MTCLVNTATSSWDSHSPYSVHPTSPRTPHIKKQQSHLSLFRGRETFSCVSRWGPDRINSGYKYVLSAKSTRGSAGLSFKLSNSRWNVKCSKIPTVHFPGSLREVSNGSTPGGSLDPILVTFSKNKYFQMFHMHKAPSWKQVYPRETSRCSICIKQPAGSKFTQGKQKRNGKGVYRRKRHYPAIFFFFNHLLDIEWNCD